MRNKGFFWFLTILLTAVCIYQLSFTWVAIDVENAAERQALGLVEELKTKAAATDSNKVALSNGTIIDFNRPEAFELAKAAMINQVLSEKAEKAVYPVIGTKFKDVKARSLAFGLDLVGGMSVTMEIDVPEFVTSYARNPRDLKFKVPFDEAYRIHTTEGGDFIDLFIEQFEKKNGFPARGRRRVYFHGQIFHFKSLWMRDFQACISNDDRIYRYDLKNKLFSFCYIQLICLAKIESIICSFQL